MLTTIDCNINLANNRGKCLEGILIMGNRRASDNKKRKSSHRRETIISQTVFRETALGESFWGGVFGLGGIHNHSATEYAVIKTSTKDIEPPEVAIKVKRYS
jgi:hypothetical protein